MLNFFQPTQIQANCLISGWAKTYHNLPILHATTTQSSPTVLKLSMQLWASRLPIPPYQPESEMDGRGHEIFFSFEREYSDMDKANTRTWPRTRTRNRTRACPPTYLQTKELCLKFFRVAFGVLLLSAEFQTKPLTSLCQTLI